jgi:ribosomal protein S18 acetylase RimI-like enzyme
MFSVEVNYPFDASRIAHLYANREDLILANPLAGFPFNHLEWASFFPPGTQNSSLLFKDSDYVFGHMGLLVKEESLYLCYVIIDPKYRGRGLARKMIKETEEFCRLNYTHRELYLHVHKNNQRARNLYEKCGLKITHDFQEKIRMKKDL